MALDLLNGRLKLRHLVLVNAIAQHGSVLRAAQHLRLPQPAATRSLREVEQILGVELFTRGPRGMRPTTFGQAFIEHSRIVLAELRRASERITELANAETGRVTVGTLLAGTSVLLPRAIAALKRSRPLLTVVVREATFDAHLPALIDGDIDMILGRLNPIGPEQGLRQRTLYREPIRLVARLGHPAHAMRDHALRDLLAFPWILPLEQTALRQELEDFFHRNDLPIPANQVECTSILTVRALLRDTDMIAAMPALVSSTDSGLRELPLNLESIGRSVGITMPSERPPTPSAQLLTCHLKREARLLPS